MNKENTDERILNVRSDFPELAASLGKPRSENEDGQATAEYALIIAAAAAIAALLLTWAARTDAIGRLFDAVLNHVIGSF